MRGDSVKSINDLPEDVYQVFEKKFNEYAYLQGNYAEIVLCAEHFFITGYEAAIAERAKFDEQNGLIVKDIGEL
jgi:hypothetical protein